MTSSDKLQTILILGSGGLRIGQAGEFDYSGSQAIKALKEEGIRTLLVNPNIATIQTDPEMADEVYLVPLNASTVTRIIEQERPDGILLSVGGQTALNLGLELEETGVLAKYNVKVLGTAPETIRLTEDRRLFNEELDKIDVLRAKSITASSTEEALAAAREIGYPIMIRAGFSLGGLGSGKVENEKQLLQRTQEALSRSPHVLVEEYLGGWKEIEYEVVRDTHGNKITVCNMENFDPMGIHTGESIVVAPSQTLTNDEYHWLREVALKTIEHLQIVGECNIQYAFNPKLRSYRVIEVNARLSRSSALASKATGYPLAFVATKLALGQSLFEIKNSVTKKTSAFFEPALDYVVVKIPRWDTQKLRTADRQIGSEMKSVGEVMAIGRSFPEALQKGMRMLKGHDDNLAHLNPFMGDANQEIAHATDRRLYAIFAAFRRKATVQDLNNLSHIDPWFLDHIRSIVEMEEKLAIEEGVSKGLLEQAKKLGFSDRSIARLKSMEEEEVRKARLRLGIYPRVKQIDTLAGEFTAETNYLYMTYHGHCDDLPSSTGSPVIIIGSGPYCIGSSVEFDWCAVNTARTLRRRGIGTVMINSNPETVSTDYDESDRLYFEELSKERVRDIADFEEPHGIVVSVGGQTANNLALPLAELGYPLLGTAAKSIDNAENRKLFSRLLFEMGIDQPEWQEITSFEKACEFAERVGYPVIVRPSYVLSGAAMTVVYTPKELELYLRENTIVSFKHPTVISKFIENAKEIEIDGVANNGQVVVQAITEHIENAGIHSGDATIVLPPQRIFLETIRRIKKITRQIAAALHITGPFNIQYLAKNNMIKVIECNLRASRSLPFVSKVTGHNFIAIATDLLLGNSSEQDYETLELDYVGVKAPQFSYHRLKGANPVPHVEMASTGEVACLGDNLSEGFLHAWLATDQNVRGKRLLVSIGGEKKAKFISHLRKLEELGWELYATEGTHDLLVKSGIGSRFLYKASEGLEPNLTTAIESQQFDLIINIPRNAAGKSNGDGYTIRRLAIDHHIPLITNLQIAQLFLGCITHLDQTRIPIKPLSAYINKETSAWNPASTTETLSVSRT